MGNFLDSYRHWRKRNFPATKEEVNRLETQLETQLHATDQLETQLHAIEMRLNKLNPDALQRILKYGVSYAEALNVFPPVGLPLDFYDASHFSRNNWWQDERLKWWRGEIDWHDLMAHDGVPIPDANNREGYFGNDHLRYWIHGYGDYRKTLEAIAPYGVSGGRYFDFGGSTGRVFRHFAFQSNDWDVWSSDFKISSVEWNLNYFPNSIKTFLNNSNPSLPIPDGYFDLVTAYSVFTHINETETAWLAELRRILRVGGVAFLSIHNEATWENPVPLLRDTVTLFRPDIANLAEMPQGKTVVTFREDDPYNCNVFHSREYIDRVWGRFFEICEIKSLYHDRQAVVICRRTN